MICWFPKNNWYHVQTRDGQVTTFPSHKSAQVSFNSIQSSKVKSIDLTWLPLTEQVKSFTKTWCGDWNQVIFHSNEVKSSQVSSQWLEKKFIIHFQWFYFIREKSIYISSLLHFNIVNICNVFLDILARCCRKINPLWLKIVSTGEEVAGTERIFWANLCNDFHLFGSLRRMNLFESVLVSSLM